MTYTYIDRSKPAFQRIAATLTPAHCMRVIELMNKRRADEGRYVYRTYSLSDKSNIVEIEKFIHDRFSESEFNECHQRVNATYNNDKPFYGRGRGRPKGSKNKPKDRFVQDVKEQADTILNDLGLDDESTEETTTKETIKPSPNPITIATPKMGLDEEHITELMTRVLNMYAVSKSDFEKHERSNKEDFLAVDHRIKSVNDSVTVIIKDIVDIHSTTAKLSQRISDIVENRPTVVHITRPETPTVIKDMGQQHKHFPELVQMMNSRLDNGNRLNIWMYGPAGSGKSYSCEMGAEALNIPFYVCGAMTAPHEAMGYCDASGSYKETMFYKAFKHGGVFCLDEIDSSSPVALQTLNGALAGTLCGFPNGEMVRRHKDFCFIGTANTIGFGADATYSARYKQDGAQMDRYEFLDWPYDDSIEQKMCANVEWLEYIRKARKALQKLNLVGVMITPRAAMSGAAMLRAGLSWDRVVKARVSSRMTAAQWAMVQAEMARA